jgi:hypothetical protein
MKAVQKILDETAQGDEVRNAVDIFQSAHHKGGDVPGRPLFAYSPWPPVTSDADKAAAENYGNAVKAELQKMLDKAAA